MPHTSETMVVKWRPMHRAWTLIPSIVVYSITGLIGALIVGFCWTLPWATPWDPWIAAILWLSMVAFVQWLLKGWKQGAIAIDLQCCECGKQWCVPAEALRFGRSSCCQGCGRIYAINTISYGSDHAGVTPTPQRGVKLGPFWLH